MIITVLVAFLLATALLMLLRFLPSIVRRRFNNGNDNKSDRARLLPVTAFTSSRRQHYRSPGGPIARFLESRTGDALSAAQLIHRYITDYSTVESNIAPLKQDRLIFFGEYHQNPAILAGQLAVLDALGRYSPNSAAVIMVMEMFNFTQQLLIDRFMASHITMEQLQEEYSRSGGEGFDIQGHYGGLLLAARTHKIPVLAGFIPRHIASKFYQAVKQGGVEAEERVLNEISQLSPPIHGNNNNNNNMNDNNTNSNNNNNNNIDNNNDDSLSIWQEMIAIYLRYPGSVEHYKHFSALISPDGGDGEDDSSAPRDNWRYGALFKAQLLKDASMAAIIERQLRYYNHRAIVYAVCGSGHCDYRYAVPERCCSGGGGDNLIISAKSAQFIKQRSAGQLAEICDYLLPFPDDSIE